MDPVYTYSVLSTCEWLDEMDLNTNKVMFWLLAHEGSVLGDTNGTDYRITSLQTLRKTHLHAGWKRNATFSYDGY